MPRTTGYAKRGRYIGWVVLAQDGPGSLHRCVCRCPTEEDARERARRLNLHPLGLREVMGPDCPWPLYWVEWWTTCSILNDPWLTEDGDVSRLHEGSHASMEKGVA